MRFFYSSLVRASILAVTVVAAESQAASAGTTGAYVYFHNGTNHYAWVDISSSSHLRADWTIKKAFCLPPHSSNHGGSLDTSGVPFQQVRVRAEIMSGDCKSKSRYVLTARANVPDNHSKTYAADIFEHYITLK